MLLISAKVLSLETGFVIRASFSNGNLNKSHHGHKLIDERPKISFILRRHAQNKSLDQNLYHFIQLNCLHKISLKHEKLNDFTVIFIVK